MTAHRFDAVSRMFAARRLSRRQALAAGGTGLAAGALDATGLGQVAAQEGTPVASPPGVATYEKITYLFVQSFQSGRIVPTEGQEGRYTVTLGQGLGETIYLGDRPSRDVGTTPTPQFLEGLGFSEDNPPNAALLMESAPGQTEIAVVELYNPIYDPTSQGVTYDVAVLANWQDDLALGLREEPADLATLPPDFSTTHLLIDDCQSGEVICYSSTESPYTGGLNFQIPDQCWNYGLCIPCEPYGHTLPYYCAIQDYWNNKCNETSYTVCKDACSARFSDLSYGPMCG